MSAIGNLIINLMARTEAFERNMDRAAKSINSMDKQLKSLRKTIGISASAFSALRIGAMTLDSMTAFHEAARKGEDGFNALASSIVRNIPIIGGAITSFTDEFSGFAKSVDELTKAEKKLKGIEDVIKKQGSLETDYDQRIRLLKADEYEKERVKAKIEYEKELAKIEEFRNEQIEKQIKAETILNNIAKLKKLAQDEYYYKLIQITDKEQKILKDRTKEINREIGLEKQSRFQDWIDKWNLKDKEKTDEKKRLKNFIDSEIEKTLSPLETYLKKLKQINEWRKKDLITLTEWIRLQSKYAKEFIEDKNTLSKNNYKPSTFEQINLSEMSISGLRLSGSEDLMKQQLAVQKRIESNTSRTNQGTM